LINGTYFTYHDALPEILSIGLYGKSYSIGKNEFLEQSVCFTEVEAQEIEYSILNY